MLAVAYWVAMLVISRLDLPIFAGFFSSVGASVLTGLLFSIWFLTRRAIPGTDRLLAVLAVVAGALVVGFGSDKSVGFQGLLFIGPPMLVTACAICLLIAAKVVTDCNPQRTARCARARLGSIPAGSHQWRRRRPESVDQRPRWSTTAEDRTSPNCVAGTKSPATPEVASEANHTLALAPGDWPGFRGENRQGELHGTRIATDWKTAPPKLVWKQRIGPAWSSFVVLGNRLFTQEQRGEEEAVVCLDAATGKEQWAHLDKARFSDGQAGAGPRSSPVFDKGRIYSMGATGVVNCLDAATGRVLWTRDALADSGAPNKPMWGFSSSPLVVGDLVIVYAGGPGDKGLLAYRVADGKPAWSVATGPVSYSSPQLVTLGKEAQVLLLERRRPDRRRSRLRKASLELRDAAATDVARRAAPTDRRGVDRPGLRGSGTDAARSDAAQRWNVDADGRLDNASLASRLQRLRLSGRLHLRL